MLCEELSRSVSTLLKGLRPLSKVEALIRIVDSDPQPSTLNYCKHTEVETIKA